MNLSSAKRAWHDAYSELGQPKSFIEFGMRGGSGTNAYLVVHQVEAGVVQCAIEALPPPVRAFGMVCYAPLPDLQDVERWPSPRRAELQQAALHVMAEVIRVMQPAPEKHDGVMMLSLCAVLDHAARAFGGQPMWPTRTAMCGWIMTRGQIRVEARNFGRKWGRLWDAASDQCAGLEREALGVVWAVICEQLRDEDQATN